MKLPQMSCFRLSSKDATSPKKARRNSSDSTASTATSETLDAMLPPKDPMHITMHMMPQSPIPDIRKEQDWFNHWDLDGLGMLSKLEATAAIQKTFRSFNAEQLSFIIDELWSQFDQDGFIGIEAMLRKQTGLVDATLHTYRLALAKRYSL